MEPAAAPVATSSNVHASSADSSIVPSSLPPSSSSSARLLDLSLRLQLNASIRSAQKRFGGPPLTEEQLASLELELFEASSTFDSVPDPSDDAHRVSEWDVQLILSYLAVGDDCQLFSECASSAASAASIDGSGSVPGSGHSTLEVTPAKLAQLIFQAGSAESALQLLQQMDERRVKCKDMDEVASSMCEQHRLNLVSMLSQTTVLPQQLAESIIACYDFLAKPTCTIYPCAAIPHVTSIHVSKAADDATTVEHAAAGGGGNGNQEATAAEEAEEEEEMELDFIQFNKQLQQTRMRLNFLKPTFLIQLVFAAGGAGGDDTSSGSESEPAATEPLPLYSEDRALLVLQHLSLMEAQFPTPTALLRGVAAHRSAAHRAQQHLLNASNNPMHSPFPLASIESNLHEQVEPLRTLIKQTIPAIHTLDPLMQPLIPQLDHQLLPALRHLSLYIGRFLPLLEDSQAIARREGEGLTPEKDEASAQILDAYLIPFFKLLHPFIRELRPYLAGLQLFFEHLQTRFLGLTHQTCVGLQTFLNELRKMNLVDHAEETQGKSEYNLAVEAFLLDQVGRDTSPVGSAHTSTANDSSSSPAPNSNLSSSHRTHLSEMVHLLILLHPQLRQLHPLMQSLLELIDGLDAFLERLAKLLTMLSVYKSEEEETKVKVKEVEEEQDEEEETSLSDPFFDEPSVSKKEHGDDAGDTIPKTAVSIVNSRPVRRFMSKVDPYVIQLQPFMRSMKVFVDQFVPFVGQLAPFYRDSLKAGITPILLYLMPTDGANKLLQLDDVAEGGETDAQQREAQEQGTGGEPLQQDAAPTTATQ